MEIFIDDDLLDFTLDNGEGEDTANSKGAASVEPPNLAADDFGRRTQSPVFPEEEEEELEWITNKEAFPPVESCFGIFSDDFELFSDTQSSVSVLDNINFSSSSRTSLKVPTSFPVRARTKRRRRRANFSNFPFPWLIKKKWDSSGKNGIKCLHCQVDKTPQWRAGPMGPKTLCNACGVRYKSGRLLPEYMPANSPVFCSGVHSNSHKKVVEMRRQKLGNNACAEI